MRSIRVHRAAISLPAAALLSIVIAGQSLGATWSAAKQLTTSGTAFAEALATVGSSTVLAVYVEHSSEMPDVPYGYAVRIRRSLDSGATWQPPIQLSSDGLEADIAARGSNVDVVWAQGKRIRYARSTNGGQSFGPSVALSPTGLPFSRNPSVARGPNGLVAVTWENLNTQVAKIRISTDGGATFGPMMNVADVAYDMGVKVAVGNDVIHVAYAEDFEALRVVSSTDDGASWSSPEPISDELYGVYEQFDIVANGSRAYLAFTTENDFGVTAVEYRGTADKGASWPTAGVIASTDANASEPSLALTGGVLRAVYSRRSPSRVFYRESSDGISWSAAEKAAQPGYEASVAFASDIVVLYRIGTGNVFARTGS